MQPKPKVEVGRGDNTLRFLYLISPEGSLSLSLSHIRYKGGEEYTATQMRTSASRPGGSSGQAQIPSGIKIVDPIFMIGGCVFSSSVPRIDWSAGQVPSSPNFAQVTNVPMHVSLSGGTQIPFEYNNLCMQWQREGS